MLYGIIAVVLGYLCGYFFSYWLVLTVGIIGVFATLASSLMASSSGIGLGALPYITAGVLGVCFLAALVGGTVSRWLFVNYKSGKWKTVIFR